MISTVMPPASTVPILSRSTGSISAILYWLIALVRSKIASVSFSGAGPPLRGIVLDAEILVRTARIVACRQDDAAKRLALADDMRGGGRRQYAALPDDDAAKAVGRRHADRDLDDLAVEIAAVAAQHQGLALKPFQRIEDRLDEVLRIVLLLENRNLLAQAGGAGLLVAIGRGFDCAYHPSGGPS